MLAAPGSTTSWPWSAGRRTGVAYLVLVVIVVRSFVACGLSTRGDRQIAIPWSSVLLDSNSSCFSGSCVVPANQTWVLDTSVYLDTLTIKGALRWDTTKDGLVLNVGYLLVESGGTLQVGTRSQPMLLRAIIYIRRSEFSHPLLGFRFLGGVANSRIEMHGRPLARTWTLLNRTAQPGAVQLLVKDDPDAMGWRAGDRIGIATTSRGTSVIRRIAAIGPASEVRLSIKGVQAVKEMPQWGETAAMAVDGDMKTRWSSWCAPSCSGADQWLRLDLQTPSRLTRIRILLDTFRFAPVFAIQVLSPLDGSWTVASVVRNGLGGWNEVPLNVEAASSIRFFADWASMLERWREPAWAGLWVNEVEVYGLELGVPPPKAIYLTEPLVDEHWGGLRDIMGRTFEMAAEVSNLERTILITGDSDDFEASRQGFHAIMAGPGIMDIRYTRLEYCGQRDLMGRYCLHLHMVGSCPDCVLQGNAVVESQQFGITLHSTHRAMVDSNIFWDARVAALYTEDGNEMNSTISNNVIVCTWWQKCSVPWQGKDASLSAGIYLIGMTNDLIGNRIVGYENGIWTHGSSAPQGQGKALQKVCTVNSPFGKISHNVNHDCARFGLYLDNQFPRNILRDENGFVVDMGSCGEFTESGSDNGLVPANVVEDEFDWHNMYVGQYSAGDVSFVRYTSVNNDHSMYWKTSKNFADGTSHHIRDSLFVNDNRDPFGQLQLFGPSGPFTFVITNTTFQGGPVGCAAICAGQHCGLAGAGGPCNVQYLLEAVDFTSVEPTGQRVKFGVNSAAPGFVLPVFTSVDDSLGGYRSLVSKYMTGFEAIPECEKAIRLWDSGYGCSIPVRRLNLWSQDIGVVNISGPGYDRISNMADPAYGLNAGLLSWDIHHGGYGAVVISGQDYTLTGDWQGDTHWEISDMRMAQRLGVSDGIQVTIANQTCLLLSTDDRSFLGSRGVAKGYMKASTKCLDRAVRLDRRFSTEGPPVTSTTVATTTIVDDGSCAVEALAPCCPDGGCDAWCTGGSQCCPGLTGSFTCPSAHVVKVPVCTYPKRFDCTGKTPVPVQIQIVGALCLDAVGGFQNGGRVQMAACDMTLEDQQWLYEEDRGLLKTMNGLCLQSPQPDAAGGDVQLSACDGFARNQQWVYDSGLSLIRSSAGSCLAAPGFNTTGSSLEMVDCDSDSAIQQWSWQSTYIPWLAPPPVLPTTTPSIGGPPAGPPAILGREYQIKLLTGTCLSAAQRNANGGLVQLMACNILSNTQSWSYDRTTGLVRHVACGLCLDAAQRALVGGLVRLWTCMPNNPNQLWYFDPSIGQLRSRSGICLAASSGGIQGARVSMQPCSSTNPGQQWSFGFLVDAPSPAPMPSSQSPSTSNGNTFVTTSSSTTTTAIAMTTTAATATTTSTTITTTITTTTSSTISTASTMTTTSTVTLTAPSTSATITTMITTNPSTTTSSASTATTTSTGTSTSTAASTAIATVITTSPRTTTSTGSTTTTTSMGTSTVTITTMTITTTMTTTSTRTTTITTRTTTIKVPFTNTIATTTTRTSTTTLTTVTARNPVVTSTTIAATTARMTTTTIRTTWATPTTIARSTSRFATTATSAGSIRTSSTTTTSSATKSQSTGLLIGVGGSGWCLDASQRTTNGGLVHQWTCDSANLNQQWTFDSARGQIRNLNGICLDSPKRSVVGSPVHMWQCLPGNANQQWLFIASTGQIKSRKGICLAAVIPPADGKPVEMRPCDPSQSGQSWRLTALLLR